MVKKHDKRALLEISQVFGTLSHVDCQSLFWNGAVISEIDSLWGSSLLSKCFKFDIDYRNWAKDSEKVFRFSDNCIWIGSGNIWQSWTGYLSSAINVLTNSRNISSSSKGRRLQNQHPWEWWKNMIKDLSWRFRKYFGRFLILSVKSCCGTALFRECSNQVFHSL